MIENVEELGAELEAAWFSKMEILGQREIEVPENRCPGTCSGPVTELAQRRRKHTELPLA